MKIEIFHDTVCPWCRIGKRHLELALNKWTGSPVEVSYAAYLLNPSLPPEGADFKQVMQVKGGGQVPLEAFFEAPRQRGKQVGLTFNFEAITLAPNSLLSHRLVAIAPRVVQPQVIDDIYTAYFEHGRDIGSLDTLVEIAAARGMEPAETRQALAGEAGLATVQSQLERARQSGISGVPFFIIDEQYAFSGAQPPDVILNMLQQIHSKKGEKS